MPGLTAIDLVDTAGIGRVETALIVGATGEVGPYAVQLATPHGGARVIATARQANEAFARELGADETIDVLAGNDFVNAWRGEDRPGQRGRPLRPDIRR